MSPNTMVAMLLIVLGIAAFVYEGINYTTRGNTVDVGAVHITTEKSHHIPLSPVAGALAIGAGITLMFVDAKRFTPAGARS
jgi:hypothetical protein